MTDYGSSMVQWIRTRKPRYKGGHQIEVERPSASYVVDVSATDARAHSDTSPQLTRAEFPLLDAPTSCPSSFSSGHYPGAAFTSVNRKIEETDHCRTMDTGRKAPADGRPYGRVHALEWNCLQLRNSHGCACCLIAIICWPTICC